jgi:hypothetical protein
LLLIAPDRGQSGVRPPHSKEALCPLRWFALSLLVFD